MQALRQKIETFQPLCEQEVQDRLLMLRAIDELPTPLTRQNGFAHFTASSWIVNPARDRVLMAYHNIYRAWAWTGGHADGDSDLLSVALREAREETGVETLMPLGREIYSLEIVPVDAHIKRGRFVSAHLHLNVTYLLEADDRQPLRCKPDENSAVAWRTLFDAEASLEEPRMAEIYRKLNARLPGR